MGWKGVQRTVLYKFLHSIGDVKVADLVNDYDVAGLEPTVLCKCVFLELRSLPVSTKDIRAFHQQFTGL